MAGKGTRLSKIAREFNVGISTIVEFLNKKGHNVDSNPNTKITEDIYESKKSKIHTHWPNVKIIEWSEATTTG